MVRRKANIVMIVEFNCGCEIGRWEMTCNSDIMVSRV